jgi:hypothetical protein
MTTYFVATDVFDGHGEVVFRGGLTVVGLQDIDIDIDFQIVTVFASKLIMPGTWASMRTI